MNTLYPDMVIERLKSLPEFTSKLSSLSEEDYPLNVEGLNGSLYAFFIARFLEEKKSSLIRSLQYSSSRNTTVKSASDSENLDFVIVVPGDKLTGEVVQDLRTVIPEAEIFTFHTFSSVPYRSLSEGSPVFGERAYFLTHLLKKERYSKISDIKPRIFIVDQKAFQTVLPPPESVREGSFILHKGEELDTVEISEKLSKMGYLRVPRVSLHGEFALRGEVLDIFLPGTERPFRIIFDFDAIEHIRTFDTDSQKTEEELESVAVFPTKEILFDRQKIDDLRRNVAEYNESSIKNNTSSEEFEITSSNSLQFMHLPFTEKALEILEDRLDTLELSGSAEGEEFLYPLVFDRTYSILDYISESTPVLFFDYERLQNSVENINKEYFAMYRKSRETDAVLPPAYYLKPFNELEKAHPRSIYFRTLHSELTGDRDNTIYYDSENPRSFFSNINYLKEQIASLLEENYRVYVFTDNENQNLRINEILKDFTSSELSNPVRLIPLPLTQGFSIPSIKLTVIQENEIFGRRKTRPKSFNKSKSEVIETFVDLNPGDYVVHVNYGIGLFKGIDRIKSQGNERDYIKIEYSGRESVFVPIEQLNLVQRYIGNQGESPRLDTLGSKSWENRKSKVKKSVEELAQKLIDLYSRRKASQGFPFPKDTEWQMAFEAAFPYEDTPDQITVTEEIKRDMEKPVPMDRLVCGDVGYGKTEIAMRAAFKAVLGGKQVAFMAPTTILAEQHYETCLERFKNFPVTISHMSRFVSPKEQKKILERLKNGEIDILIGTHRIIQKDVIFKNLGLMIIDEEQRFGVKDKERLKVMKNNIDSLAMSATPIPRTLHMSLLKIRDMSLLTTPPQNRQPVETVVGEYDEEKVVTAIRREIDRGGQVFYLHNRVETLVETRLKLERLMPEMLIDVAHGQMSSDELDDIFGRFKNGGFHILVATTIIENGIDIPNVNTIIIDRANMYGVSQLYQLRGRVGRSDRKAYAYLFYQDEYKLSEVAEKRLKCISDFTELGSGFKIAMKDMEIRGAGNLLGKDQSGDVYSVGFDLYMRLLNEAVEKLTSAKEYVPQNEVLLELEYTGFIPDTYVTNPQTKMEIYKKISAVMTRDELDSVYLELSDRFGPIPDEVGSLLTLAEIRVICKTLSISSLKEKAGEVRVEFSQVSKINIDRLLRLIKENSKQIRLNPVEPNILLIKTGKIGLKEKSAFICEKLESLAG